MSAVAASPIPPETVQGAIGTTCNEGEEYGGGEKGLGEDGGTIRGAFIDAVAGAVAPPSQNVTLTVGGANPVSIVATVFLSF